MIRVICWLRGHGWSGWITVKALSNGGKCYVPVPTGEQYRYCIRCGESQIRGSE